MEDSTSDRLPSENDSNCSDNERKGESNEIIKTTSDTEEHQEQHNQREELDSDKDTEIENPRNVSLSEASSTSQESSGEFDEENGYVKMSLLKYGRIAESLRANVQASEYNSDEQQPEDARPLSIPCRCSTLGQVVIQPIKNKEAGLGLGLSSTLTDATNDLLQLQGTNTSTNNTNTTVQNKMLLSKAQRYSVLALAMEDGSIHLINAQTGEDICPSRELKVYANQNSNSRKPEIVALSFDSGANYLAALTSNGDVAIFELRYGLGTPGMHSRTGGSSGTGTGVQASSSSGNAPTKLFDNFLSRLAGDDRAKVSGLTPPTAENNAVDPAATGDSTTATSSRSAMMVLCLTQPVSTARFSYEKQNNPGTKATCLALDPSYNRKREKEIIVGFSNGRLIHTKRSGFGGIALDDHGFGGVMGSLLQPKRHDLDLHQSVGGDGIGVVVWRGSLVAWADDNGIKLFDIEKMNRIAHIDKPSGARASLYPHISSLHPSLLFERSDSLLVCWGDCLMNMTIEGKKVKCNMAWELDCVGCDVQPIDADHVAVLGLSPASSRDEKDGDGDGEDRDLMTQHIVELQIIKRLDGSVTASDILPLAVSPDSSDEKPSTADFTLSSSFATPRMEDSIEAESEEVDDEATGVDIQNMILDTMASSINEKRPEKNFTDQHMKWSVESYTCTVIDDCDDDDEDDDLEGGSVGSMNSDDSDDYTFLFRPDTTNVCSAKMLTNVPTMVIRSRDDVVLTQIRDVDDSIEYARKNRNFGSALRHGLHHRQMLRRHTLDDLIDDYLTAILNPSDTVEDYESPRSLSIRRLNIAVKSMPILIGGKIHLWERWSKEFSRIPGGLLLLRPYLPVRDPKLPTYIYETFLIDMFSEIEEMLLNGDAEESPMTSSIHENAVDLFLGGLRAWGAMSSIRDRMKLYRSALNNGIGTKEQLRLYNEAESAFSARMNQSAAVYLVVGSGGSNPETGNRSSVMLPSGVTHDSLFSVHIIKEIFEQKLSKLESNQRAKSAILEVIAELYMMEGNFSQSLQMFIMLGAQNSSGQLSSIENMAVKSVFQPEAQYVDPPYHDRYKHVLTLVETNELHRVLLDTDNEGTLPPLVAFTCLVGLQDAGRFIIDHCILPESEDVSSGASIMSFPLDMVANQLEDYPKLLLWFLHSVISFKPEIYVKFPNTAVPSPAVTSLHQIHFELYIKFADRTNKSERKLSEVPSFDEIHKESALLRFLKAALPHGGIRSEDVRNTLEHCRSGIGQSALNKGAATPTKKVENPHLFAHELAFVIERSGAGTDELSNQVLILYLEGVASLPLAVEYAERNVRHSSMLWDNLVSYCLAKEVDGRQSNGKIFGSLLEVAARSGADLAHLVSKIPKNLSIDGIRPRLVAAISDYQIKVQMHKAAYEVLSCDKVALLREQYYRSRRGNRVDLYSSNQEIVQEEKIERDSKYVNILLKPWKEGKDRLTSKRKERQGQNSRKCNVGMDLPRSLEIT